MQQLEISRKAEVPLPSATPFDASPEKWTRQRLTGQTSICPLDRITAMSQDITDYYRRLCTNCAKFVGCAGNLNLVSSPNEIVFIEELAGSGGNARSAWCDCQYHRRSSR